MARYEIVFVVEAPDELAHEPEDVVKLPWWPFIGEEPMSPDWLEYILVRELIDDENTFDFLEPEGINIVWEDREQEKEYLASRQQQLQKKEPPEWLKLVVNNDEQTHEEKTDDTPKE